MATSGQKTCNLIAIVTFCCFNSFTLAAHSPFADTFTAWSNLALEHKLVIPWQTAQNARTFDYVFVAGFLSEVFPDYFVENIQQLKATGITDQQISVVRPPSAESSSFDQDYIGASLRAAVARAGSQLVLIGHSRGASDLLAYLIRDSDWAVRHVGAVFLIDGAFGGSGIADYLLGRGPKHDTEVPLIPRELDRLLAEAASAWLQPYVQTGIESVSTSRSQAQWRKILDDYPKGAASLSDRVFYICSHEPPTVKSPFFYPTEAYLQAYYGPNDGVVTYDGQYLPEVGTRLMDVIGNHHDLVHSAPTSRRSAQARYAVTAAIEMAVGTD